MKTEFLYRPMYRPVHFATMPKGVSWDYVEAPAIEPAIAVRRGLPLSKWTYGIICTSRALTPEEREEYQLDLA